MSEHAARGPGEEPGGAKRFCGGAALWLGGDGGGAAGRPVKVGGGALPALEAACRGAQGQSRMRLGGPGQARPAGGGNLPPKHLAGEGGFTLSWRK